MGIYLKRQRVPKELAEVYVDFYWSQEKLWNLSIEAEEVEISELEWILDFPIWYTDEIKTPRLLIENSSLDPLHWGRVEAADLSYPIHIMRWKEKLLILDGVHRLIKAMFFGHDKIFAKIVRSADIENILPVGEDLNRGFLKTVKLT